MSAIAQRITMPLFTQAVKGNTAGQLCSFKLEPLFDNRTLLQKLNPFSGLFHGSSAKKLGDQLETGKFEVWKDKTKIYADSLDVALTYATKNKDPIVVEVASKQKRTSNEINPDGMGRGLGLYSYFQTDVAPVQILRAFRVVEIS